MDTPKQKRRLAERIMANTGDETFTGIVSRLVDEVELLEARIEALETKARGSSAGLMTPSP